MQTKTEQYLEMAHIRLSILQTAVEVLQNGQNNIMKPDAVMKLADVMEDFVFGFDGELDDLEDMLDLQLMDESDANDFDGKSGEVN